MWNRSCHHRPAGSRRIGRTPRVRTREYQLHHGTLKLQNPSELASCQSCMLKPRTWHFGTVRNTNPAYHLACYFMRQKAEPTLCLSGIRSSSELQIYCLQTNLAGKDPRGQSNPEVKQQELEATQSSATLDAIAGMVASCHHELSCLLSSTGLSICHIVTQSVPLG